jgi:hypothetical protein
MAIPMDKLHHLNYVTARPQMVQLSIPVIDSLFTGRAFKWRILHVLALAHSFGAVIGHLAKLDHAFRCLFDRSSAP